MIIIDYSDLTGGTSLANTTFIQYISITSQSTLTDHIIRGKNNSETSLYKMDNSKFNRLLTWKFHILTWIDQAFH